MDEQLKKKWLEMAVREMSTQCKLANAAFDIVWHAPNTDVAFLAVQAFLSHCANVSKMLQAHQEPKTIARCEFEWRAVFRWLRRAGFYKSGPTIGDLLQVRGRSSVHHEGRMLRNHLEHYDQRLFAWLSKYGPQVGIGDFNVMPKPFVKAPKGMFIYIRNLDPAKQVFTFVDKDINLGALNDELSKIKAKADAYLPKLVT